MGEFHYFNTDNAWWSPSHMLPLCVLTVEASKFRYIVHTCNQTQGQYL